MAVLDTVLALLVGREKHKTDHVEIHTGHNLTETHRAAASPHTGHATLSGGKVPTAELGGTGADSTKYLRGDRSWAVPASAVGVETLADAPNGTDDTTALTNAYTTAAGGILRLRPGTYKVASTLAWGTLGTTVVGCGIDKTIIQPVGAFVGPFARVNTEKHHIADLSFDGLYTAQIGLLFYRGALSNIERVRSQGFTVAGVRINQDVTTPTGNNNLLYFEGCDFSRNNGHGCEIGPAYQTDSHGIEWHACTMQGNGNVAGQGARNFTKHGLMGRGSNGKVVGGIYEANGGEGIKLGDAADGPATIGWLLLSPWLEGNAGNYNKQGGVWFSSRAVRNILFGSGDLQGRRDDTATSENVFLLWDNGNKFIVRDSRLLAASNAPTTSLNGAISTAPAQETVETWTVTSTTGFAAGKRVIVDAEILNVESVLTGTTLSLRRGVEGTATATHANAATLQEVSYTDLELASPNGFNYSRIGVSGGNKPLTVQASSFALGAGADPPCNLGIGGNDNLVTFGNGKRLIGLKNADTIPPNNPVGGGVLYAEGGALKWRGSAGTITTIAPA